MIKVGSFCSGIGGIELGLEWTEAFETVWFCENDAFAQQILQKHWPDIPIIDDVKKVTSEHMQSVEMITAGFPCQPVSVAGKQKGRADERWLWPYIAQNICMAMPRYILLENVPGIRKELSWVIKDLASFGYFAEWNNFAASEIGAWHRRSRFWLVATTDANEFNLWQQSGGFFGKGWASSALARFYGEKRLMADAIRERKLQQEGSESKVRRRTSNSSSEKTTLSYSKSKQKREQTDKSNTITKSRKARNVSRGGSKLFNPHSKRFKEQRIYITAKSEQFSVKRTSWWSFEPRLGRVAYGIPDRLDRLKCLGNAVVPQCSQIVGLRLIELKNGNT
jgi:DNA (cytosine-5)-methyltransferase 1